MTKTMQLLAAVSVIALTAPAAFAQDNTTDYKARDNGGYKVESESKLTTGAGTDKRGSHVTDVEVDDDGTVTKTVEDKSKADPKGLMNRRGTVNKTETERHPDGSETVKSVREKYNAAGTNIKNEVERQVEVGADGVRRVTEEKTKIVDPKGLMNRSKETTKTVNGRVVD